MIWFFVYFDSDLVFIISVFGWIVCGMFFVFLIVFS